MQTIIKIMAFALTLISIAVKAESTASCIETQPKLSVTEFVSQSFKESSNKITTSKHLFSSCISQVAHDLINGKRNDFSDVYLSLIELNFYSPNREITKQMKAILDLQIKENTTNKQFVVDLFKNYLLNREFEKAKALKQEFKAILKNNNTPNLIQSEKNILGREVLIIEPTTKSLTESTVQLYNDYELLIVMHPYCKFSRSAMDAIKKNPDLFDYLKKKAIFIAPPSSEFHIDDFTAWHNHYGVNIYHIKNSDEWPEIKMWDTPTFYFLNNRMVKNTVLGWPSDAQVNRLLKNITF